MHERSTPPSLRSEDVPVAVRVQILATEHWSLLATRSMTWGEVFSRAGIFLTVVSASVVALALVAQATDFGDGFYVFALLVLPIVLVLGVGTLVRLGDALTEDVRLVFGMNRLRHAYLEIAPELEPYFVTSHYDDEEGVLETLGPAARVRPSRFLSSTPVVVGLIDAVLAGILAGLVARVADAGVAPSIALGAVVGLAAVAVIVMTGVRGVVRARGLLDPRFPRPR
jgi:hypothetical protein